MAPNTKQHLKAITGRRDYLSNTEFVSPKKVDIQGAKARMGQTAQTMSKAQKTGGLRGQVAKRIKGDHPGAMACNY